MPQSIDKRAKETEIILKSFDVFKESIIDAGFDFQTTFPEVPIETVKLQTRLLGTIDEYKTDVLKGKPPTEQEKLSAEKLYGVSGQVGNSGIGKIVDIINECREYLRLALENFEEEALRENQMVLLLSCIYEFDYHRMPSENLYDLIINLKYGLYNHRTRTYKEEEIQGLKQVFDLMRKTLFMSDEMLDSCLDILDKCGFELSAPFTDVDIDCNV
jgi:hypothetical protein